MDTLQNIGINWRLETGNGSEICIKDKQLIYRQVICKPQHVPVQQTDENNKDAQCFPLLRHLKCASGKNDLDQMDCRK